MQQFGDFEVMRKHVEELYWNDLSLDSKCNEMVKEIKEAMAKTNDLRTFMRVELLVEAQKQINSAMQLVVGDLEKQMEELRMKGSSLENKYNQMVKEVTTKINELSTPMHELLVQAQKLNSTMQHVICEFEATCKETSRRIKNE